MAYKLIVSKETHKDIDEIVGYIALQLKNPEAATSFLNNIEKSYKTVIDNPYIYTFLKYNRLQKQGYRKIIIKNYLIIYRVNEEEKAVIIVRIVYGGRNYTEFL
jgi:addiction module RelE/StbE family toxin